jgi:hypothetical protein
VLVSGCGEHKAQSDTDKREGLLRLRGTPVSYVESFEPVAAEDWESSG